MTHLLSEAKNADHELAARDRINPAADLLDDAALRPQVGAAQGSRGNAHDSVGGFENGRVGAFLEADIARSIKNCSSHAYLLMNGVAAIDSEPVSDHKSSGVSTTPGQMALIRMPCEATPLAGSSTLRGRSSRLLITHSWVLLHTPHRSLSRAIPRFCRSATLEWRCVSWRWSRWRHANACGPVGTKEHHLPDPRITNASCLDFIKRCLSS
jgi:hypothetical protein